MNIVTQIKAWQTIRKQFNTHSLGFIPTMGCLHEGHLSLVDRAKRENDRVVVSIFVNPTQFNQEQDFLSYPNTLEQDTQLLIERHVDYLFLPQASELYSDHYSIKISEETLSAELEGAHRPGHFTGMLTVVLKLLNLIQAHRAYFGEKDYQQLLLVKKMVEALFIPTDIMACDTCRAKNGLALSSRNTRLSPEQQQHAAHLFRLLNSELDINTLQAQLLELGFKIDYVEEKWQRRLAAVWLDGVRLIDNTKIR
ncbi:MAG: pantoate--beta-alanine ligase [Gammaproteobacteria bacterium]|nr:pantoate--beta-alanine ligase [Gammaproteobacteria bacterium]